MSPFGKVCAEFAVEVSGALIAAVTLKLSPAPLESSTDKSKSAFRLAIFLLIKPHCFERNRFWHMIKFKLTRDLNRNLFR